MHSKEFTLMELIIVLLLMAILALIAVPTYKDYQRRQTLERATSALSDMQKEMETYYQKKGRYARLGRKCGIDTPDDEIFQYKCYARSKRYSLVATNKNSPELGNSGRFVYTVNHRGAKKTRKFAGHDVKKSCWLLSVSDC